jgi:hypothetical protein
MRLADTGRGPGWPCVRPSLAPCRAPSRAAWPATGQAARHKRPTEAGCGRWDFACRGPRSRAWPSPGHAARHKQLAEAKAAGELGRLSCCRAAQRASPTGRRAVGLRRQRAITATQRGQPNRSGAALALAARRARPRARWAGHASVCQTNVVSFKNWFRCHNKPAGRCRD